jgi:hypothetical protein
MTTLDDFRTEIAAYDAARSRSLQTEPGASQTFGCRAETVLRANSVPESDVTDNWAAIVGTSLHSLWENAAVTGVLTEYRTVYRGVPATVDRYSKGVLTDLKSKKDGAAIAAVERYGPNEKQIGQIMLGAAGLIAEGYEVHTVELLFVPRSGSLDEAFLWSAAFEQAIADKAADWHEEVRGLIRDRVGLAAADQVDGLRDELPSWCFSYCNHVSVCRGPQTTPPPVDDRIRVIAAEYIAADEAEKQAKSAKDAAKKDLALVDDLREVNLRWQGGGTRYEDVTEVDTEAALAAHEFVIGPLPTRSFQKAITSARSLRKC